MCAIKSSRSCHRPGPETIVTVIHEVRLFYLWNSDRYVQHRVVLWELLLLIRAHWDLDILCLQNRLDALNLIPCLEVVLGKDCVLCASTVIRHLISRRKHALVSSHAHARVWILILDSLAIDHGVWPRPWLTVTWSLVHNAEILTHCLGFLELHVLTLSYFLVRPVFFLGVLDCTVLILICSHAIGEVCHAHTAWFERVLLEMWVMLHAISICLTCNVLISDWLCVSIGWDASIFWPLTEHWWSWAWNWSSIVYVSFRVSHGRRQNWERVLRTRQLLVHTCVAISEHRVFNLLDSLMGVSRLLKISLQASLCSIILLYETLHSLTCQVPVWCFLLSLLACSKQVIDQVHWQIFLQGLFFIQQILCTSTCILWLDGIVFVLLTCVAGVGRWCEDTVGCWPGHDLPLGVLLLSLSFKHREFFHHLFLVGLCQVLVLLCALLVNDSSQCA